MLGNFIYLPIIKISIKRDIDKLDIFIRQLFSYENLIVYQLLRFSNFSGS